MIYVLNISNKTPNKKLTSIITNTTFIRNKIVINEIGYNKYYNKKIQKYR